MHTFDLNRFPQSIRACVAFCSFLLVGCVHYSPVVESGDHFSGLEKRTHDNKLVRLFVIHGMGTHPAGYSTKLVNKLAAKLNFNAVDASAPLNSHPIQLAGKDTQASLQIYHLADKDGKQRRMVIYEYFWSPITTPVKKAELKYDEAIARAKLNKEIKLNVVNDGLSDAVLYVKHYQESILNKSAVAALGEFITRKYDTGDEVSENEEVAFFSSSLGSIMLFDAINSYTYNYAVKRNPVPAEAILTEPSINPKLSAELRTLALGYDPNSDRIAATIKHTGLFVMFANQLPLLKLAEADWTHAFKANAEIIRGTNGGYIDIVVMSDPNDLLSYRLETVDSDNLKFHNIAPHNAGDLFGIFENPVRAHSGYQDNEQVIDIVINGL